MSTLREALEALLEDYDELTEDWKGLAGRDLRELLAAHPAEVPSESVEIPDAAVKDAFRAIQAHWYAPLPLTYADVTAALVAARPYLMPTREEIAEALSNATRNLDYKQWETPHGMLPFADAVMALLNGEIKKGEDR